MYHVVSRMRSRHKMANSARVCVYLPPHLSAAFCRTVLNKFSGSIELTEVNDNTSDVSLELQKADVLVSVPKFISKNLQHLDKVKWAHSIWAGVNELVELPTNPSFILTRHAGSYGQLMAEYVIAQIVNWERKLYQIHQAQLNSKWDEPIRECLPRMLSQLSISILGVGEIGSKIAEVCKAFGMTVWGLSRTGASKCPHVDHYRLQDGLPEVLANGDYVCNVLPSTSSTRGMLNGDKFKSCADKKSVFINVGRGDIVSNDTVITAIKSGWLGGAILDVFEEEPLPGDSELWRMPEVVITPHLSALAITDEIAEVFVRNLELYLEGKEMKYIVDWSRGY